MTRSEIRASVSLAAIFAFRLLGLFMIYPVFADLARNLAGASPMTIGLALGGYGFTQALLQIPFGFLSDRIGRKTMIAAGLIIFGIGSVVAASADTIHTVIIGRVLQGGGAIGSVVLALLADLTRDENRTKAMGLVGVSIGFAFALALVIGPIIAAWIGLSGIFWLTAGLALVGLLINAFLVPDPVHVSRHLDAGALPQFFATVLRDRTLLRLDFGILTLHATLTASFLALPHILSETLGVESGGQWRVYLPVMAASLLIMVPAIVFGEKYRRLKAVFVGAVALLLAAQLALLMGHESAVLVGAALLFFFGAFNTLEASLPSLISKIAPVSAKGTAIGVYSSSQFLGIFVGGALGGWVYSAAGLTGIFTLTTGLGLLWLGLAATMAPPPYYSSRTVNVGTLDDAAAGRLAARLNEIGGVVEAVVLREDRTAHLKIDRSRFDEDELESVLAQSLDLRAGSAPG